MKSMERRQRSGVQCRTVAKEEDPMLARRFMALFFVMAMAMVLAGCGHDDGGSPVSVTTAQTATGALRGKIVGDGDMSGIPVYLVRTDVNVPPTASIRAEISSTSGLYLCFTGTTGEFVFDNVPVGDYNLLARKSRTSSAIQRNIRVSAAIESAATDLVLSLTTTGDITGQVAVPSGFSSSGLIAFVTGTSYAAYADEAGQFMISGVPVGTYTIVFMAPASKGRSSKTSMSAPA